jgi:hypothetical protein
VRRAIGAAQDFWFQPAAPFGLIATRGLLAAQALWIVLSRPDLAGLAAWPPELWAGVGATLRLRYAVMPGLEPVLFGLLVASLAAALVGLLPRAACLISGLLLYHFAPFEEILTTSVGPYLRGLTLPTLGLLILAAVPAPSRQGAPSPDYRWPVQLVRLLLAFQYLGAGIGKLHVGLHWASAANIQRMAAVFLTYEAPPPWGRWLLAHPGAAAAAGAALLALDFVFVLAIVSRRAARVILPLAVAADAFLVLAFGVFPLNAPLLLLLLVDGGLLSSGPRWFSSSASPASSSSSPSG